MPWLGCCIPMCTVKWPHSVPWASVTERICLCRLFEYFAIITLINQVGITVFRAIAAIGRAVVLCNVLAFVYIAYALLLCGFIIPLGTLPLSAQCMHLLDLEQGDQQISFCCALWAFGIADEAQSLCRLIASLGGVALLH